MTVMPFLFFTNKRKRVRYKGSAIIETAIGMFMLVPIFLILLDIIALVIGQTINDDIAKNAARYAAQGNSANAARSLSDNYMSGISYAGSSGLVSAARISGFDWNTTQVRVVTEVTINLPVAVPFGGPKSQVMQSQATEPTVGVPATPPSVAAS